MRIGVAIIAVGLLAAALVAGCGGAGGYRGSLPVTVNINGLAENPKAAVLDADSDGWITLTSTHIPRPPEGWYDVDFTLPLPRAWDGAVYAVVIYNDYDYDNRYDAPDELLGFMDHYLEYYDFEGHWVIAENGTLYEPHPEEDGVYIQCEYDRALRSATKDPQPAMTLAERNAAKLKEFTEAKTHLLSK